MGRAEQLLARRVGPGYPGALLVLKIASAISAAIGRGRQCRRCSQRTAIMCEVSSFVIDNVEELGRALPTCSRTDRVIAVSHFRQVLDAGRRHSVPASLVYGRVH